MSERKPDAPAEDLVSAHGELILYPTDDGRSRVTCRLDEGTLWLSQAAMAELYQTSRPNVSMHLKAIFAEGEVDEKAVVKYFLTTGLDGKNYQVGHYHLDAVLAVGYRVEIARRERRQSVAIRQACAPDRPMSLPLIRERRAARR
jgi:hypothetical protein